MPTRYTEDHSSDDSLWSSDSYSSRPKRRSTRKTKAAARTTAVVTKGSIRKPKKPGRKPMENPAELPTDPKLKRKAQNRAAQRAFRERKEQFVTELQQQIAELKAESDRREKELTKENARLKKENARLKEENQSLKNVAIADGTVAAPSALVSVSDTMESSDTEDEDSGMCTLDDEEKLQTDETALPSVPIYQETPPLPELQTLSANHSSTELVQADSGSPINPPLEAPLTMPSLNCYGYCGLSSPYSALDETDDLSDFCESDEDNKQDATIAAMSPINKSPLADTIGILPSAMSATFTTIKPINTPTVPEDNMITSSAANQFFTTTTDTSDIFLSNPMQQYDPTEDTVMKDSLIDSTDTILLRQQQVSLFGENLMDFFDLSDRTASVLYANEFVNYDSYLTEQLETIIQQDQQQYNSNFNSSEKSDTLSNCPSEQSKSCRERIIRLLNRAKGNHFQRRSIYQINEDVKKHCSKINIEQLCEGLGRQINIDKDHILSDREVDIVIECIARAS